MGLACSGEQSPQGRTPQLLQAPVPDPQCPLVSGSQSVCSRFARQVLPTWPRGALCRQLWGSPPFLASRRKEGGQREPWICARMWRRWWKERRLGSGRPGRSRRCGGWAPGSCHWASASAPAPGGRGRLPLVPLWGWPGAGDACQSARLGPCHVVGARKKLSLVFIPLLFLPEAVAHSLYERHVFL